MIWNVRLKCFSMFSLKSRLYQDFGFKYTPDWTIWSSKFQKISGEGLTEPPPQTPPPLFLGLRPRFGLRPQISGASRPRFGLRPIRTPQLLNRGCALGLPPPGVSPCNFFDHSNHKNRFIVSVTMKGRHILTYVTSSWSFHVTYVMTSDVYDGGQNACFYHCLLIEISFDLDVMK